MTLIELLDVCKKHNISVSVVDGNLKIKGKKSVVSPEVLSLLKKNKEVLISFLAIYQDGQNNENVDFEIVPVKRNEKLQLSYAQQRLWFIDELEQGSSEYNLPLQFVLSGQMDVSALQRALQSIVDRHEVLRSVIIVEDGQAYQQIRDNVTLSFKEHDLRALSLDQAQQQLKTSVTEDALRPFDLRSDVLMRAQLFRLAGQSYHLFLNLHHIAADGWSIGILLRELNAFYNAYSQGQAVELPPLNVQYADFAHSQRQWLRGDVLEKQLSYWRSQLQDLPTLHSLPIDKARPAKQRFEGKTLGQTIRADLSSAIHAYCQREHVTLFMFLYSAFAVLLNRYSGETDIVMGSPIAGRTHSDVEPLIGLFVNSLVLRSDATGNPRFSSLLQRNKNMILAAYEHQNVPFEMLVEQLQPERSLSHSPLFQVMLTLHNNEQQPLSLHGLQLERKAGSHNTIKCDVELTASVSGEQLFIDWSYNIDLFEGSSIERMGANFEVLLAAIVAQPEAHIEALPLLCAAERQQLLYTWNDTAADFPSQTSLSALFEAQALAQPDALALIDGGDTSDAQARLSYRELNAQANQLAHYLRAQGLVPGSLVGLCMERSLAMVVGMLAILKAGAAYLPLDPDYPSARLAYLIADAKVDFVITETAHRAVLPNTDLALICLDDSATQQKVAGASRANLDIHSASESVACVIYTSGSTGEPKGVLMPHRSIINRLHWMRLAYPVQVGEVFCQKTSLNFVDHVAEIFQALTQATPLVMIAAEAVRDVNQLVAILQRERISRITLVPSLLNVLLEHEAVHALPDLRYMTSSGEALSGQLAARVQAALPHVRLLNIYGSTEVGADVTCAEFSADAPSNMPMVSMGRPIANSQAYVLDAAGELLPIGAKGELHIGGAGLALGYLHQAALTAQRFIAHPFAEQGTLYKTGDIVRWLPDGQLAYLGRKDHQVKIRGMRIEIGEIEAQLCRLPEVKEAVVMPQSLAKAGQVANSVADSVAYLVAYIVQQTALPEDAARHTAAWTHEYRKALKQVLPDYMLPDVLMFLPSLPLTKTGKLNRFALPLPVAADLQKVAYVAPRNETEVLLCQLWQNVLQLERIGIEDNFFELGGHSLLATRLMSLIRQNLGIELPLRALFEQPSVAALAESLPTFKQTALIAPISLVDRSVPLQTSFAQQRLWFIDQLEQGSSEYNLPIRLDFVGQFKLEVLRRSLQTIVERHEVLRTVIVAEDGRAQQQVKRDVQVSVIEHDLRAHADAQATVQQIIAEDSARPFVLMQDVLLRAHVFQLDAQHSTLFLNLHHIAADGWSIGILLRELGALYNAFLQGQESPLPALSVQYADYAHWQRTWLQGDILEKQLSYWRQQLLALPAMHSLPLDLPRPAVQGFAGRTLGQSIDADLFLAIEAYCQREKVTLFMFLYTALAVLLKRYSNEDDIVLGTPIAGRTHSDVEPLIGLFVNSLVLRSDVSGNPHFQALLQQNKHMILAAYEHQYVPFEMLVDQLQPERSLSHSPLFQILLTLQNNQQDELVLDGLSLKKRSGSYNSIKCDIEITALVNKNNLYIDWSYNLDLFTATSIERMGTNFEVLLRGIVGQPQARISELPLVSEPERQRLLVEWNDTALTYPGIATLAHDDYSSVNLVSLVSLFAAQVAATPQALAIADGNTSMTYAELNASANRLAHYLQSQGVGIDSLVGLSVRRSVAMVVGMLAIVKAGAAYVPLDPEYPLARLQYMLSNAGAQVVVTESALLASLPQLDLRYVCLDDIAVQQAMANCSAADLAASAHLAKKLAYVIYTSGSTGLPKGVCIEHRALANFLQSMAHKPGLSATDRLLAVTSISFDIAGLELFLPLVRGAQLYVASSEAARDSDALQALLVANDITIMQATPATWRLLLDGGWQGKSNLTVLCGGEAWPVALNQRLQANIHAVWNVYGPTETTIWSTIEQVAPDATSIVMGGPIANTQLYVLDEYRQLVPTGGVGELYIGGAGLARGYWQRDDLTLERFIAHPFEVGSKLYRTGDLVRWNAANKLEYLSRQDHQVKIRGFRIEIGEIETQLATVDVVRSSVVLAKSRDGQSYQLVAYVEPHEDILTDKDAAAAQKNAWIARCKQHLSLSLPDFMVPEIYVFLPALPLTSNRKIDRKALPDPVLDDLQTSRFVAPSTEREHQLCEIWRQVLKLPKVGVFDNFFALGGDSILSIVMVSRAQKLGMSFTIKDVFAHKTIFQLAKLAQRKKLSAPLQPFALLDATYAASYAAAHASNLTDDFDDAYPISAAQLGIIVQSNLRSDVYHDVFSFHVQAAWDEVLLSEALTHLVKQHPVLRTSFDFDATPPLQRVHRQIKLPLTVWDWRGQDEARQRQQLAQFIETEKHRDFVFEQAPLFHIFIIRLQDKRFVYSLSFQHAILDGWSASVFNSNLFQAYLQRLDGVALAETATNWAFRDFVALQIAAQENAESKSYWQAVLSHAEGYQLPRLPSSEQVGNEAFTSNSPYQTLMYAPVKALSGRVIDAAQAIGEPVQSLLLAAHYKVLAMLSNRKHVISTIGMVARPEEESATDALGLFVNATPLALALEDNSWLELIASVTASLGHNMEHMHAPVENPPACLAEIIVNYTHFHAYNALTARSDFAIVERDYFEQTNFDFHLSFYRAERSKHIEMEIKYKTAVYSEELIQQIAQRYEVVLQQMLQDVHAPHRAQALLLPQEAQLLLSSWNVNPAPYPRELCTHELFEEWAARTPDKVAATFGSEQLTYGQLNQRANRLAHYLRSVNVKPDDLVAMLVERSIDMLVCMVGIVKAGAAYVPIDANYPKPRVEYMLKDSQTKVILSIRKLLPSLPELGTQHLLVLDDAATQETLQSLSADNLPCAEIGLLPQHLAYVIYTSGSTGNPKGVMVEHRNIVSLVCDQDYIQASPATVFAQASSVSFDAATFEIWTSLTRGASMVLVERDCLLDVGLLAALLREHGVTVMFTTTALVNKIAHEMADCFAPLKFLLFGGEEVNYTSVAQILQHCPGTQMVHVYGPTETTTFATFSHLHGQYHQQRPIPIGRPMANMEIYVLGGEGMAPIGTKGELYIGGAGVARGYLGLPHLSDERFIPNRFSSEPNARMYATGDIVRWLPDGQIEFLGRVDRQVKISGFRIELSEVEFALTKLSKIKESLVLVRDDDNGGKRMLAYVVPKEGMPAVPEEFVVHCKQQLKATLPDYMIPSVFVVLPVFPLNANGKIEVKSLPAPSAQDLPRGDYVEPKYELEKQLCEIWQDVLKLGRVGIKDNFFEVGGSSLLVIQVRSRIEKVTLRKVSVADLFSYPTISDLTRYLLDREAGRETVTTVRAVNRSHLEPIAIIGLAGRFPGAKNVSQLWQNLVAGVESLQVFSDAELAAAGVPERLIAHPDYVKNGVLLDHIEEFDAPYFSLTPREAQIMDPQQRVLFECAVDALENGGYGCWDEAQNIGVFVAVADSRYLQENLYTNPDIFDAVGALAIRNANSKDGAATRLSYKFNFTGPSINVNTACSSSLVAVHEACKSLWLNECEMALAGGADIALLEKRGYLYSEGDVMSQDGHCNAFDEHASGTRLGSGGGLVLLKRLSAALADQDTIHAVLKGSAINNDGANKVGYTAPSVQGQAECIRQALAMADVPASSINYVESHGTGTKLGDPIEIAALTSAFNSADGAAGKAYCALGSIKTNIGHLNTAAGIAGLIKTVEALKHQQIPASLNFTRPNPQIDFAHSPFFVNNVLRPWSLGAQPRRAAISSFGIGGTNAHAIVEEAPLAAVASSASASAVQSAQLIKLSARSDGALLQMCEELAQHLHSSKLALADVAYTLQVGRRGHEYAYYLVVNSVEEAISKLQKDVVKKRIVRCTPSNRSVPVVWMFPGQGSQYPLMAADLYAERSRFPVFAQWLDTCLDKIAAHLDVDLRAILLPASTTPSLSEEERQAQLRETAVGQPALFVVEYALAMMWQGWGITPAAMIGHSIGEYVAACLAGVFSLDDALMLVAARGRLMQSMPPGRMLSVMQNLNKIKPLAKEHGCCIAAINTPRNCVLAGTAEQISAVQHILQEKDVDCTLLPTSHAFHSAMMEPILGEFSALLSKVRFSAPNKAFISNLSGKLAEANEVQQTEYWVRHLRETVNFAAGMDTLLEEYDGVYLEIGPGTTLGSFGRKSQFFAKQRFVASLRHRQLAENDVSYLLASLSDLDAARIKVEWRTLYQHAQHKRVPLPSYPYQRSRHWIERKQWQSELVQDEQAGNLVRKPMEQWFSSIAWQRESAQCAERVELRQERRCWLVFADQYGLFDAIEQQLLAAQQSVVRVDRGSAFAKHSDQHYTLRAGDEADYQALLKSLSELATPMPSHCLHLWSITPPQARRKADYADFLQAQECGLFSLLYLARGWANGKDDAHGLPLQIHVLTNDVLDVLGDEELLPAQASVTGLCSSISQEYPHIACHHVDLSLRAMPSTWRAIASQVLAELSLQSAAPVIALRGAQRWSRSFVACNIKQKPAHAWQQGGVYLITGGLGKIGLLLARYLAEHYQAKLVLLSRRPFPEASTWQQGRGHDEATQQKMAQLQSCLEFGAQVMVRHVDVSDYTAMQHVLREAEQTFGKIAGVIHCAGDVSQALQSLAVVSSEQALQQFLPKVKGVMVLEQLLQEHEVGFCLLMSSLSTILGGIGYGIYAASNVFMDSFCHEKRRLGDARWISVDWDGWYLGERQEGKLFDMLHGKHISSEEGGAAMSMALQLGQHAQLLCSTTDLQKRYQRWVQQTPDESKEEQAASSSAAAIVADDSRNTIDASLLAIWRDLFGMPNISINDSFFALGGDSLLLARLMSRIRADFGAAANGVTLGSVFKQPFIEDISNAISAGLSIQKTQNNLPILDADLSTVEQGEI